MAASSLVVLRRPCAPDVEGGRLLGPGSSSVKSISASTLLGLEIGLKDWLLTVDTSFPPSLTMWSLRNPYRSKIHLSRAFKFFFPLPDGLSFVDFPNCVLMLFQWLVIVSEGNPIF